MLLGVMLSGNPEFRAAAFFSGGYSYVSGNAGIRRASHLSLAINMPCGSSLKQGLLLSLSCKLGDTLDIQFLPTTFSNFHFFFPPIISQMINKMELLIYIMFTVINFVPEHSIIKTPRLCCSCGTRV